VWVGGGRGKETREISQLRYARYCIRNISYAAEGELYKGLYREEKNNKK
jgi:hypothetical protein